MSTEKMREEFEAWFASSGMAKFKETAWAAWQASRAAIEVELPQRMRRTSMCMPQEDIADMTIWNRAIDASQSATESHGLRVKS